MRSWLTANNLEPRLSPFDPMAIFDEIQRLVPGYDKVLRLQLLSGNDQHLETSFDAGADRGPRAQGSGAAFGRYAVHLRHAGPLLRHAAGSASE